MRHLLFKEAKRLCKLPDEFQIRNEQHYEIAIAYWKHETISASKRGDQELLRRLSQAKQTFKLRLRNINTSICPRCGCSKGVGAFLCRLCHLSVRYYPNAIVEKNDKTHEIEEVLQLVPPVFQSTGVLTPVIRKLAMEGKVGDSFLTDKQSTTIKNIARSLGMEVIVRISNPFEKDKKKRLNRVWRSDGLDMHAVNEVIRKRLNGESVPETKPCEPRKGAYRRVK